MNEQGYFYLDARPKATEEQLRGELFTMEQNLKFADNDILGLRERISELEGAIKEWAHRMDETHPGWRKEPPVTDLLGAQDALRRIAEGER